MLAWALVRCTLFGHCSDEITEEYGDLLEVLADPQASFPDKPAEWLYRATYRLLAGKVEKVRGKHCFVNGLPELGDTTLIQRLGSRRQVQVRLLLQGLRLRAQGEDILAHRHRHAL